MDNVIDILSKALKNLADEEIVAINAKTARAIQLEVEPGTPADRPVEFSVAEIRAKLSQEVDGADV